jgi:hypothetical protein
VLTSLVEAAPDSPDSGIGNEAALQLLEEAVELFNRCLVQQERQYAEAQSFQSQMEQQLPGKDITTTSSTEEETSNATGEEDWATVLQPVTTDDIMDTIIALVDTYTSFCSHLPAAPESVANLANITAQLDVLISAKSALFAPLPPTRATDLTLSRANLHAAVADLSYRAHSLSLDAYTSLLTSLYSLDGPIAQCQHADALIALDTSIRQAYLSTGDTILVPARWRTLSDALSRYTAAARAPEAPNASAIHLARGDVEMQRWRLARLPYDFTTARANQAQLLANAATCYRGAEVC